MTERIIVAQPAVDGHLELAVGALPQEDLTLIAKLTLSFEPGDEGDLDGPARIMAATSLEHDKPSRLPGAAEDELFYPSDFVPSRSAFEVAVTGHLYAERPALRLDASLAVGDLRRAWSVRAGAPTRRLPLLGAYLADGPCEPPLGELPPGAAVDLMGLSPRSLRRVIELPKVAPRAVVVRRLGGDLPVELRCDTLWIDTDAERMALVYRGWLAVLPPGGVLRVDVWLDRLDAPRPLHEVRKQLARGVFRFAEEPSKADESIAEGRLDEARFPLWQVVPEPTLTLAAYARISAELMEKREPRADTLARHGLDEHAWGVEERASLERFAKGAMGGDAAEAAAYGELFLAAQESLAAPDEAARPLDDYARVKAAMNRGADPTRVLAFSSMTLPVWMRLDRRLSAQAARDPAFAAELARRVAAAEVDPSLTAEPELEDPEDTYGDDDAEDER